MGNSLRCCLACALPFGVLDVSRVVHLDGKVEEFFRPVTAGEILGAYPSHALRKLSSDLVGRRIISPETVLERGAIYFLIPNAPSLSVSKKKSNKMVPVEEISQKANQSSAGTRQDDLLRRYRDRRRRRRRVAEWSPKLESIPEKTYRHE